MRCQSWSDTNKFWTGREDKRLSLTLQQGVLQDFQSGGGGVPFSVSGDLSVVATPLILRRVTQNTFQQGTSAYFLICPRAKDSTRGRLSFH